MNRPTTRTEQMLASASKGVSSWSILAEAAGFVETGEIFVAGRIQGLLRRAGEPRGIRSGPFERDDFMYSDCRRVCVLTGVYQIPVPRRIPRMKRLWPIRKLYASTIRCPWQPHLAR